MSLKRFYSRLPEILLNIFQVYSKCSHKPCMLFLCNIRRRCFSIWIKFASSIIQNLGNLGNYKAIFFNSKSLVRSKNIFFLIFCGAFRSRLLVRQYNAMKWWNNSIRIYFLNTFRSSQTTEIHLNSYFIA